MIKEIKHKYEDKNFSMAERKVDYAEKMEKMMNPFKNFNVSNFEPDGDEMRIITNRKRVMPLKKLKTYGLKPKETRTGQMIGMYESKQDIYLTFAHRCNQLQNEIDNLKKEINILNNK